MEIANKEVFMAAVTTVCVVAGVAGAAVAGVAAGRAFQRFQNRMNDMHGSWQGQLATAYVATEIIKGVGRALVSPSKSLSERYGKHLAPTKLF